MMLVRCTDPDTGEIRAEIPVNPERLAALSAEQLAWLLWPNPTAADVTEAGRALADWRGDAP